MGAKEKQEKQRKIAAQPQPSVRVTAVCGEKRKGRREIGATKA